MRNLWYSCSVPEEFGDSGGVGVGGYHGLMWSRKVLSRTGDGTRLERCLDFDRWGGSPSRRRKQNMRRPGCENQHWILGWKGSREVGTAWRTRRVCPEE